ncbi:unnamed protein product [Euphydryas editha]|uniref:PiggyBac transposable element-derived protein domain-containing protein n=1 Tax=Euphydryas editha TaxID=104508 RepID=A0AAU9UVI2_EUPED|nr:unnamed protein product [Euphydryas editha]
MLDAYVYLGKGSYPTNVPSAHFFTLKLTEKIHGTNRNLTCDNWFTSIPVAKELLQKQVTLVGTLRRNKREIPPSFLEVKDRDRNTAKFAYSEELTLLSYCPPKSKQKKIVPMLSTMHATADYNAKNRLPEIVEFYNKTKIGVDLMDQCYTYSVSRRTKRWPMALFFGLMNIRPSVDANPAPTAKKRCAVCPRGKDRKTKVFCGMCRKPLCGEHTAPRCEECVTQQK